MKSPDKPPTTNETTDPNFEEKFHRLFETSRDGIVFVDGRSGTITGVNPAMETLLGYSQTDLVGKSLGEIECLGELPDLQEILREFQRKKTFLREDLPLQTRDGRLIYIELVGSVYRVGKAKVLQLSFHDIVKRKQAKEALEETKHELERFFNLSIELMCIANTGGYFLYLNPAWEKVLGYSEKDLLEQPFFSFIHPDDVESTQQAVRQLASQQDVINFVNRYRCKDGTYRCLEWRAKPSGGLIFAAAHDITDRRQTETALHQSEEMFRLLAETSFDMISRHSPDGTYLYASPACRRLLGYEPEEMVGRSSLDFIHPDDRVHIENSRTQILGKKENSIVSFRIRRKDGTDIWVEANSHVVKDQKTGAVIEIQVTTRDVTERKKAEEWLDLLKFSIDTSPDSAYWMDREGRFIYANEAGCKSLGYSQDELLQLRIGDVNPRVTPELWVEIWKALLEKKHATSESIHRRKDGSTFPVEISSTYVRLGDQEYCNGFARDISERKQAEGALRTSETRYRTLAEAAHDMIFIIDRQGRVEYVNEYAARQIKRRPAELIGLPLAEVFPQPVSERQSRNIQKVFDTAKSLYVENEAGFLERRAWLGTWLSPIKNESGEVESVLGTSRDITERIQVENALRESEKHYRDLFENAVLGAFQSSPGGKIIAVNQAFARMFGYESPEEVRESIRDIATEIFADPNRRTEILRLKAEEPSRDAFESLYRRKDGSTFIGLLHLRTVTDANNQLAYLEGFVQDITERKQMTDALRQSETEFRTVFENSTAGVALVGLDGKYLMVNPAFCRIFGYSAEELLGMDFFDITHPEDAEISQKTLQTVMNGQGDGIEFTKRYIHKDGHTIWAEVNSILVFDTDGQPKYFVTHITDVTERKQAEEALRESETKYRAVIETTDTGYVVLDESGRVVDANLSYARLTGHNSVDEILGRDVVEWTAEHDLERNRLEVINCLETGSVRYLEIDYRHPDGTFIPVEINASVIATNQGKRIVTLCRDITARKKAEEAMREAEWRNQIIAQLTTDYIFVVKVQPDGQLQLVWASDSMKRLTGRGVDDAPTLDTWTDVIHPDDRKKFFLFVQQILASSQAGEIECRTFTTTGIERWVQILVQPQVGDGGKVDTIIGANKDITERKQAEMALRDSEEKFSKAFHTSPDSININRQSDGVFVEINQGFTQLAGYTLEDVTGKSSLDINLWANIAERERLLQALRDHGEVTNMEAQFRLKDGTVKTGLMSARLIVVNNEPCILSITRDISERKQVEDALQRSEERMREIVDAAPFGAHSYELLPDNCLVFSGYNRAADQILGTDHSLLIGKTIEQAFPGLVDTPVPDTYRRVAANGDRLEDEQVQYDEGQIHGAFEIHAFQTGTNRMTVFFRDISERKKAEEKINLMNERLNLAARAAHLGVWDWDINNNRLVWDERMFELYGIDKKDFSSTYDAWLNRVHPDDKARCDEAIKTALSGKKDYEIEFRAIWPDGTVRFIKAFGQVMRNPGGSPVRMTGVNYDITASKLAEEELFNSKQMLLTVLDTIPQRVFWKDRNLVYVGCNKPLALDCGYEDPAQLIGKTDYETASAATADLYRADDRQVMETGIPKVNYEELQIKADGSQGWLITSKVPLLDKEGQVIGVLGTYDDITERKRAEEALQQRESYLTAIIENQPGLVWLKDEESRFLAVNRAFAKSCGLERPELIIGKNDFDVWPSELAEQYKADDLDVMRKKTSITVEEPIYDSGVAKWFETFKTPVVNDKGEIIGTTGYAHDITDRKRADDALRESERLLQASQKVARLGSYMLDAKSGIWKSSPILDDIFGIDPSYLHDIDGWLAIIHPDEQAEMANYFSNDVISRKQRFDREYRIIRQRDGSEQWVHGLGDLELDAEGNVLRMVGTIQDITERKQAGILLANQAEELSQRNAELARLYRASRNLISVSFQSLRELAQTVVDIVTQDLGKSNCSLLLVQSNSPILNRIAVAGPYSDQISKVEVEQNGPGLVPKALRTRLVVNVKDVLNEPDYVPNWKAARSELAVPLHVGEKTIGVLDIQSADLNAFDADDERILDNFAEQAALALEHALLFEAEQRRINRLAALQRLATELAGIHNRRELLDTLVDRAAALAESPTSTVMLIDTETEEAVLIAQTGLGSAVPSSLRVSLKAKIFQETIMDGKPLIIPDIDRDAPQLRSLLIHPDLRAIYVYPLIQSGKVAGVITLSSLTPRTPSEGESTTYNLLAKLTSAALDNVELFEETNSNLQRLASLRAVDMVIASSFDTRLTLSVLLEQLISQLHVDAAAILTYNPLLFTLRYECSQGFRTQSLLSTETHIGEGLPGQVVRERRTIHIPDLHNQIGRSSTAMFIREEKFLTYFGVPIIAKGQIKGVLEIYNKEPLSPDPEWLDFLDMLAGQAAIAIDNAELFNNLQRSNSELSMAYDDTLEGWASALDLRDKETQGHTRRVTDMTIELARAMNIRDINLLHVRWGALLHDIGKMGIPDEILRKPDTLTDEEWVIMRQHPQYAYDMLAHISYLRPALDIPFCHHEKWNGSGYPRGLAGEQIPISARIFSIVDVWDALLSDRSYRKAWPYEKVLEYIQVQSGSQFDPAIVQVFLENIASKWQS